MLNAIFLSIGTTVSDASSFVPILIQALLAIFFVAVMLLASYFLGPKRKTKEKLVSYESGVPSVGNARRPVAIKYFLVAILFVLFDVEVIFFYPYAVNFRELGQEGFLAVLLFASFFAFGLYYIIKKGALKWED